MSSLLELGLKVLNTHDADKKAALTIHIYNDWKNDVIKEIYSTKSIVIPPEYPARPINVETGVLLLLLPLLLLLLRILLLLSLSLLL